LSNAVQNSMNAGDNSLIGGLISATTLVLANWLLGFATYRNKRLEALIEGRPLVLIHHGQLFEKAMSRAQLTHHELNAAIRQAGVSCPEDVLSAILENNGAISVIPKSVLGGAGGGCRDGAGPRFEDVTARAGITFRYNFGDFTYDNILESSGSGVAVFDYDGDGKMDILFLNGRYIEGVSDPKGRVFSNAKNALYRNNGDGTFPDVTEKAGLGGSHWSMAATIADLDGDGLEDIFLSNYGPNTFFHNNGDG